MNKADIIKGCQKGRREAQEALYGAYADRLFRLSCRYIKVQADAEDVMIHAFNKIFEHVASFRYEGDRELEAWMKRIVVNEALMWLRRRHNFNMMESIDETHDAVDLSAVSDLEAEDILKFIMQLPTGYRTVFNLSVVEGYHHDEIAAMLNISESTSRSQLFKAKELLRTLLTKEGFHYGT